MIKGISPNVKDEILIKMMKMEDEDGRWEDEDKMGGNYFTDNHFIDTPFH
ncbi:hypothetical protein C2G38_2256816 [Gigaspora rosea]|uniref:Uncharacterized protein n=1 Tax=Gigaspora rosea TaxID=44941 RepID=A0A397TZF5_9GLOM|nr:hypothetical protein C2G38_2256816 [Gigaspora rosea]